MPDATSFDDYVAALPADQRAALESVRALVRAAAPDAIESFNYDIPTYRLAGKQLVAFAAFKKHCSFFPMSKAAVAAEGDALEPFKSGQGTLKFTPQRPIPPDVVTRIVKARVAEIGGG